MCYLARTKSDTALEKTETGDRHIDGVSTIPDGFALGQRVYPTLFQVETEEVNNAAQTESCDGDCKDRPQSTAPCVRIPVHHGGSEILDPFFFIRVPIEWGLKCSLQCAPIALWQRNKPEWLLGGGDREEHLRGAKHGSSFSLKDQINNGTLIQRGRQGQ
jgi:hypothetical protein